MILLGLMLPAGESRADPTWTTGEGEPIAGELVHFDFEAKEAIFEDDTGARRPFPTTRLSHESHWRLLLSPVFAKSFPKDEWAPEQIRYVLIAVAGPVFFLLISFYLCALILFKNGNPLRAVAGWVGSALLGGFLGIFYLVLSGRSPASATGILVFGGLVSAGMLSLYVSAIYGTSVFNGLKLLVLHVFGAFFFFAISLIILQRVSLSFDLAPLVEEYIMVPTGLISVE